MMAIAIATTLQVPAQESKTKLTAQQRTEQRIKEMDEKLTLSDEQKTKIRELYADFNKQKYPREKRREAREKLTAVNPEKRNEPSCKNEVVQNLQKRSVQKSTSAQYKKAPKKTYFFGAFLLLVFWLSHQKSLTLNNKEYIIFGF